MNLFILFSLLLLNKASPGSCVPVESSSSNCGDHNATLSNEDCSTCLCDAAAVERNVTAVEVQSNHNETFVNGDDAPKENFNETGTANQVCQPNDVKMEECNRCKCAANGIGWFCTRRACPPSSRHQRQTFETSRCTRGTRWTADDGCNTCYCSENRVATCTNLHCDRKKRSLGSERRCTPGHHWKNDCNDCFCTETGVAACTLRGCLPERSYFHSQLRPSIPINATSSNGGARRGHQVIESQTKTTQNSRREPSSIIE